MSYLVLARKYRPQTFEDLVGQDHVARTLANAIGSGRIAHAFLFTGVRGVGKTTSARLLAKCLNCVGPDGKSTQSTATPCNVCFPCREITAGQDLDVQEIDGASYNGVDEVRRLQEGMSFRPARDRFKIYIVDEVHMLSTAAWNAFLKTLEEPPPHVKFIFATTEAHKVPITILSRCQRYDFKLISTQTIARRIEQVLGLETIEADASAVQVIAREAAGSMRDAMSLLDQVIAFSGTKLAGDDVTRVLGVADRKILHELAAALVGGDPGACLGVVDRLAQQGFDIPHVAKDILFHLRNLVVAKVSPPAGGAAGAGGRESHAAASAAGGPSLRELLDLADEEIVDVIALAARAELDDLSRLFQGFSRAFDDIVRSGQPRMALEMSLVRLARRPALLSLDELLARVGDLERRLGGSPTPGPSSGPAGAKGGATGPSGRGTPAPTGGGARTHGALALAQPLAHPHAELQPQLQPQPQPVAQQPGAAPPWALPAPPSMLKRPPAPAASPAQAPSAVMTQPAPRPPVPAVPAAPAAVPVATPPAPLPPPSDPVAMAAWRAVLERLRADKGAMGAFFDYALPLEVTAGRLVIGFEPTAGFQATRAAEPESLEALTRAARAHFGSPTEVVLELAAKAPRGVRTVASLEAERRAEELAAARATIEAHPVIRETIRLFGAQLRDVKLPAGNG